jgi:hypothetical protein
VCVILATFHSQRGIFSFQILGEEVDTLLSFCRAVLLLLIRLLLTAEDLVQSQGVIVRFMVDNSKAGLSPGVSAACR